MASVTLHAANTVENVANFFCDQKKMNRLLRAILRALIPLSPSELAKCLLDEVEYGISDASVLMDNLSHRKVFNEIYDVEIAELYNDPELIDFLEKGIREARDAGSYERTNETTAW